MLPSNQGASEAQGGSRSQDFRVRFKSIRKLTCWVSSCFPTLKLDEHDTAENAGIYPPSTPLLPES